MSTVSAETSPPIHSFKGGAGVLIFEGSGKQSVNPLRGIAPTGKLLSEEPGSGLFDFFCSPCRLTHSHRV